MAIVECFERFYQHSSVVALFDIALVAHSRIMETYGIQINIERNNYLNKGNCTTWQFGTRHSIP